MKRKNHLQRKGNYVINILYCGDKNIKDGLIMSVLSLLQNTKDELHIYVMTAGCKWENKTFEPMQEYITAAIEKYAKSYNPLNTVTLINATKHFEETPTTANLGTRFTPMCMLRLFADKTEAIPDKILYLDYDVICKKSIVGLYDTDIENYELAGVLDRYGKWFFRNSLLKLDYINSGVLLLNMKKIKETGLFAACRKRCTEKKMFMPDQSAINKLAKHKLLLPKIYNEQKTDYPDTVLRHFTTFFRFFPFIKTVSVKPWHTEKMHGILKTHQYDELTQHYNKFKKKYLYAESTSLPDKVNK